MASLTIRNLDDRVKERLRVEAAHSGHSMEEEARLVLHKALNKAASGDGLGSRIRARFAEVGMFEEDFADRILGFGAQAAMCNATLVATRERSGRPISLGDAQIAATCRAHGTSLATRNIKNFVDSGVPLINPWLAA